MSPMGLGLCIHKVKVGGGVIYEGHDLQVTTLLSGDYSTQQRDTHPSDFLGGRFLFLMSVSKFVDDECSPFLTEKPLRISFV